MNKSFIIIVLTFLVISTSLVIVAASISRQNTYPGGRQQISSKQYVSGEILVTFQPGITFSQAEILIKTFQLKYKPIATGRTMEELTLAPCDLDANGQCDSADLSLFQQALGKSRGDFGYNPLADADADGVVTAIDRQMLLPTIATGKEFNDTFGHSYKIFVRPGQENYFIEKLTKNPEVKYAGLNYYSYPQ